MAEASDPRAWVSRRYDLPTSRWEALAGRAFWITGAGTGFGRALTIALAAAGAQVFLTGRRPAMLEQVVRDVDDLGLPTAALRPLAADITAPSHVASAVAHIEAGCPFLHGLVNNAAQPPAPTPWPLTDDGDDRLAAMLRINVTAHWQVTRAVLPHMVGAESARLLFMTSAAGWSHGVGAGPYNVSKAALNALTASLAAECTAKYPDRDVQINALDPGEARTEMNPAGLRDPASSVTMALLLLSHPPGGPTGRFFSHDGGSRGFGITPPYDRPLA